MRKTLMAASVLALVAGSASAATVSYSGSTGSTAAFPPAVGNLSLTQFDSSLGTLTGISISWTSSFDARFAVAPETPGNTGTASAADGFVAASIISIAGPTAAPDLSATGGTAFSVSIPPSYSQDVSGGDSDVQALGPLAAFIGLGTVNYSFIGGASDTSTVSSGLLRGIPDFAYEVDAEITYTYTTASVPVPAALPLLATAFGALGVMRLRRKA